jgi:hypothetical protein
VSRKSAALVLLGLVSLATPLLEAWFTGRVEPFSKFDLAGTFLSIPLIFFWYHLDKREHGYHAGPLMNVGVVALSIVALPIYFIRSRGWKRGAITMLLAGAFLAVTLALGEVGERIGAALAS